MGLKQGYLTAYTQSLILSHFCDKGATQRTSAIKAISWTVDMPFQPTLWVSVYDFLPIRTNNTWLVTGWDCSRRDIAKQSQDKTASDDTLQNSHRWNEQDKTMQNNPEWDLLTCY